MQQMEAWPTPKSLSDVHQLVKTRSWSNQYVCCPNLGWSEELKMFKTSKIFKTYVMLDNCSQRSFIRDELIEDLGLLVRNCGLI